MEKITNNKKNNLNINIGSTNRILPVDNVEKKVNEYKQYLKEKKESDTYRLTFTLNPICSNVLFNNVSEIVYKEGSDECVFFSSETARSLNTTKMSDYLTYKGYDGSTKLNRIDLIRDTGFSHPEIGPVVYHCGFDIFNNHTLRKREFSIVNRIRDDRNDDNNESVNGKRPNDFLRTGFNTIYDYKRRHYGHTMKGSIINHQMRGVPNVINGRVFTKVFMHLYEMSTIKTFYESITDNLTEENGWVGFINNTTLEIPNYVYGTKTSFKMGHIVFVRTIRNDGYLSFTPTDRPLTDVTILVNIIEHKKCTDCDGSGTKTITVECDCGGGKINGTIECPYCLGVGYVGASGDEVVCEKCGGNGVISGEVDCPKCKGMGEIVKTVTCSCGGRGYKEKVVRTIQYQMKQNSKDEVIVDKNGGKVLIDGTHVYYVYTSKGKEVTEGPYQNIKTIEIRPSSDGTYEYSVKSNGGSASTPKDEDDSNGDRSYSVSLNKTMNNNKAGEFIDMYPDRSLYSFIPKINKYRGNRIEPNWDVCLTYPYENYYGDSNNQIVQYLNEKKNIKSNGIKCKIKIPESYYEMGFNDSDALDAMLYGSDSKLADEYGSVTLTTQIKNNFREGSLLSITLIGEKEDGIIEKQTIDTPIRVSYKDTKNGNDNDFTINTEDLFDELASFKNPIDVEIRVRQIIKGEACEYYFRKYKKIHPINNPTSNFNTNINKMGFGRNIYSDEVVQIMFNDDVNIRGLRDNLGRELSEIYLTIVKNNKGHEKWYNEKKYKDESITFSHCFGEVTSGIDLLNVNEGDFNIHKIHNINRDIVKLSDHKVDTEIHNNTSGILEKPDLHLYKDMFEVDGNEYRKPHAVENDIKISDEYFIGDIVEFSPATLEEFVLEEVYHRFNTAQREYYKEGDNEYYNIIMDEIVSDDYDRTAYNYSSKTIAGQTTYEDVSPFKISNDYYNCLYSKDQKNELLRLPVNISPEGYYYKAHYRIPLKRYKTNVEYGYHKKINVVSCNRVDESNRFDIVTKENYYLETKSEDNSNILYLNDRKNVGERRYAVITSVSGDNFTNVSIDIKLKDNETVEDFLGKNKDGELNILTDRYILFKPNVLQPETSYEYKNNSGKYAWRELLDESEYDKNDEINNYVFTNGAHYINKNVNFFLRRQDPYGIYGLSAINVGLFMTSNLTISGNYLEKVFDEYYEMDIDGTIC